MQIIHTQCLTCNDSYSFCVFVSFLQPVLAGVDLDFEGAVNAAVEAASGMQLDTVTEAALAVQVPQDDGDEEAANASNANHHFLTHHHHTPEDHPTLPPLNTTTTANHHNNSASSNNNDTLEPPSEDQATKANQRKRLREKAVQQAVQHQTHTTPNPIHNNAKRVKAENESSAITTKIEPNSTTPPTTTTITNTNVLTPTTIPTTPSRAVLCPILTRTIAVHNSNKHTIRTKNNWPPGASRIDNDTPA